MPGKLLRRHHGLHAWLLSALLSLVPDALAQEDDDSGLEDQLLNDADFPDLVSREDVDFMSEIEFLQDGSVVELAARHRQEIGLSPSAVTVITRDEIDTSGATVITDLLRQVPGLEIVNMTPMFTSLTGRVIWNYEAYSHQVLLDGRQFKVDVLGFVPWTFMPVFLEDIERIEVIRGPGSALYGANALGGVVSITTRAIGERDGVQAFVQGGESGSMMAGARGDAHLGPIGISVGTGVDLANRWGSQPRTNGKQIAKLRATAEYQWTDSDRLRLTGSYSSGTGTVNTAAGNILADFELMDLQASYRSESLRGHLGLSHFSTTGDMEAPLDFGGISLARFARTILSGDTLDAELQWTVPRVWEPLMVILGAGAHSNWLDAPDSLNGKTFSDPDSPAYHQAGLKDWTLGAGAFVHAELTPVGWLALTAGTHLDVSTNSSAFVSPRLAAVFQPREGQFLRLGVSRSFRRPTFWESTLHVNVDFPQGSPFTGPGQDRFREFMTRVLGNEGLRNEVLTGFEAGYLGQFLDERLSIGLDVYYNLYQDEIELVSSIVPHELYLVDLEKSSFLFENMGRDLEIIGSELSVRYQLSSAVSLHGSWTHREVFVDRSNRLDDRNPKNLITLGARLLSDQGWLGSLFVHTRSEFWDRNVDNPAGLMEPYLEIAMPNVALLLARSGYRWQFGQDMRLEAGVKLFLPLSPWSAEPFRLRERGGGNTTFGRQYGADEQTRVLTLYLTGSF